MAYDKKYLRWENNKTPDNTMKVGFYDAALAGDKYTDLKVGSTATDLGYFKREDIPAAGAILDVVCAPAAANQEKQVARIAISHDSVDVGGAATLTTSAVELTAPVQLGNRST